MVDGVGENGFDDRDIINNPGGVWEKIAVDPPATLSFLGEVEL